MALPHEVIVEFGRGLTVVQYGEHPPFAAPLHGLGSGMFELRSTHAGNAYRLVYLVRSAQPVFVLYAFQKRSVKGRKTPRTDLEVIRYRRDLVTALLRDDT